ncbi:MAG: OmpH family outer membrane protein [Myxococcota bacterium]|nr:OmpH family outer membrane protein [Myxococcota bacterium]
MRLWGIVLVALTTLSTSAVAAKDFKVAYVDSSRIMREVKDAKKAQGKLQADLAKSKQQVESMQQSFIKQKEAFDKKAPMMKPDVRQKIEGELQSAYIQIQQDVRRLQMVMMEKEQSVTVDLQRKVRSVIGAIGDREGYTMVLDIAQGVLYHKRHMDITDQVIAEYNKRHK